MTRAVLACWVMLLISLGAFKAQEPATPPPDRATLLASVRDRLTADCTAGRFSGIVRAVENGSVVFDHACGLADVQTGRPTSADTVFKAFSISKGLTGLVMMQLAQDGVVSLDDPLRKYAPEAPSAWQGVTLRQLLHHDSGLPDLTEDLLAAYTEGGAQNHETAMRRVLESVRDPADLEAAPAWRYNNFGYELLALAASRASGRPFADLVRDKVFSPASMHDAAWEQPPSWVPSPRLAQGYNGAPDDLQPATSLVYVQQGAGALHASANDFLALDRAWRSGVLVSQAMSDQNLSDAAQASETVKYGYGWMIREVGGHRYLQHSGGTNGFVSEFARGVDRPVAVVVLSNLGFAEAGPLRRDLMRALLQP